MWANQNLYLVYEPVNGPGVFELDVGAGRRHNLQAGALGAGAYGAIRQALPVG